jgi:hypothetical protein
VPTEQDVRDRIALLRTADVSLLLKNALPEIEAVLHAGRVERASGMVASWEDAFGKNLVQLTSLIDQVRGQTGYIRALAAFSREQQAKAVGIAQFARGVFIGSRRLFDRWRWVPWLYAQRIEEFMAQRLQRLRNSERLFELSGRSKKVSLRAFRVLHTVMEGYRSRRDQWEDTPELYAHTLTRMGKTLDAEQAIAREKERLLTEREAMKERVASLTVDGEALRQVTGLSSVRAQIAAYQALLDDEKQRKRQKQASEILSRVDAELRHSSLAGSRTEEPTLLALADRLERRT